MTKLLCLSGRKRSGKTTFSETFRQIKDTECIGFGDAIKKVLRESYDNLDMSKRSGVSLIPEYWEGTNRLGAPYDREQVLLLSNQDVCDLFYHAVLMLQADEEFPLRRRTLFTDTPIDILIRNVVFRNKTPWSLRRLMQVFGTDLIVDRFDENYWVRIVLDKYMTTKADYLIVTDVRQAHEERLMRRLNAIFVHILRDVDSNNDDHASEKPIPIVDGDHVMTNDGSVDAFRANIQIFTGNIK